MSIAEKIIQEIGFTKFDFFWIFYTFFSAYGIGVFTYVRRTNRGEISPEHYKTNIFEKWCMMTSIGFILTVIVFLIWFFYALFFK